MITAKTFVLTIEQLRALSSRVVPLQDELGFTCTIDCDSDKNLIFVVKGLDGKGGRLLFNTFEEMETYINGQINNLPVKDEEIESELLPCPFCGGEDLYVGHIDARRMGVNCMDCFGQIDCPVSMVRDSSFGETEAQASALKRAKERWNRRWNASA